MRVYCGTFHKYNCGSIFGEWIDLTDFTDKEDFLAYCAKIHEDEKDPEFMFQDYEDIPEAFISESWVSEMLWELPSDIDIDALAAFMGNYGIDPDKSPELFDKFQDSYQGEFDSFEQYAEQFFDDVYLHDVPEHIRYYIDYEKFARDLEMDHAYIGGYVFRDF